MCAMDGTPTSTPSGIASDTSHSHASTGFDVSSRTRRASAIVATPKASAPLASITGTQRSTPWLYASALTTHISSACVCARSVRVL